VAIKRSGAVAKQTLGANKGTEDLLRAQGAYQEDMRIVSMFADLIEAIKGNEEVV